MTIERPGPDEYASFYAGYVGRVTETDILDLLGRQIDEWKKVAASVTPSSESYRYAPDKWSVRELFGHLTDAERFFGHRAFCFSRGDQNPLPGFDEKVYVERSGHDGRKLADHVQDLSLLREGNVRMMKALPESAWSLRGTANNASVSVRALAYIMAGHVRHHLAILKERYGIG